MGVTVWNSNLCIKIQDDLWALLLTWGGGGGGGAELTMDTAPCR